MGLNGIRHLWLGQAMGPEVAFATKQKAETSRRLIGHQKKAAPPSTLIDWPVIAVD